MHGSMPSGQAVLEPETRAFYRQTLNLLEREGVAFLVGGAYALAHYTGVERHTKDLDLFVRSEDVERALAVLAQEGYRTELTFPHWLAKAGRGEHLVDIIFNSGNGVARVDERWFEHAVQGEVVGLPALLCPVEETLWSKAFIMERERFDGADVIHLLRARGELLDWRRVLERFGEDWRVLLAHLVLFGYVYPSERSQVPAWVVQGLLQRMRAEEDDPGPGESLCRGTLISRAQYLADIERWGYKDARVIPKGNMTETDTERWTAAIDEE